MLIEEIDNETIREAIEGAMKMRQQAASMEREAEELKRGANELLLPLFDAIGDEKVEWEGVGTVSRVTATRTTVDNAKLKEELVARGVRIDKIVDSFDAASKTTESTSVRFMAEKVR